MSTLIKIAFLLAVTLLWTSCHNQIKFESKKWKIEGDLESYPFRDKMLTDIVDKNKLNGLNYNQLIDSLGYPFGVDIEDDKGIYYLIENDYGTDIDPVYSKYLILTLDNDSIVVSAKIYEWDKFK